jgi:prepilin-type N-terminal cleavage/methylation domain-containing protein
MNFFSRLSNKPRSAGFTLVELAVVVVIIGVLAAFAVPRFMDSVERSKAAEAYNYLSTIHSAQERYHARQGEYSTDLTKLDVKLTTPTYFTVGTVDVPATASSIETGWELTLTRTGAAAGYGAYTVIFNEDGFDKTNSTIPDSINPFQTP